MLVEIFVMDQILSNCTVEYSKNKILLSLWMREKCEKTYISLFISPSVGELFFI